MCVITCFYGIFDQLAPLLLFFYGHIFCKSVKVLVYYACCFMFPSVHVLGVCVPISMEDGVCLYVCA